MKVLRANIAMGLSLLDTQEWMNSGREVTWPTARVTKMSKNKSLKRLWEQRTRKNCQPAWVNVLFCTRSSADFLTGQEIWPTVVTIKDNNHLWDMLRGQSERAPIGSRPRRWVWCRFLAGGTWSRPESHSNLNLVSGQKDTRTKAWNVENGHKSIQGATWWPEF